MTLNCLPLILGLRAGCAALLLAPTIPSRAAGPEVKTRDTLPVALSWGHTSGGTRPFWVKLSSTELSLDMLVPGDLEAQEGLMDGAWQSRAGAGDVDQLRFILRYPARDVTAITNLHSLWHHLLTQGDPDAARRLRLDPAARPDSRKLTVQLNPEGTRGFSLTVDQLLTHHSFWMPELDLFLATGDPPIPWAEHQRRIEPSRGRRILDRIQHEPEASYAQFIARWEDMGNPGYQNPAAPPPGHIVGLTWDSALHKFGIDRAAGVWNDLGKADAFRLTFDFPAAAQAEPPRWISQKLQDGGLPIIETTFENQTTRIEVEQFAYPLHGPPPERRGDMPMVLLQKVRLRERAGQSRTVPIRLTIERGLGSPAGTVGLQAVEGGRAWVAEETVSGRVWLAIQGEGVPRRANVLQGAKLLTYTIDFAVDLPADGTTEVVVKLPSPRVEGGDRGRLLGLDYDGCRVATAKFWSDYLARGARVIVPEEAVNTLFRAGLWHALRLPRRHRGPEPGVRIDLPYSNFAYDQTGAPWPVNQAVYVDYMLYDLRGYHDLAEEELASMFHNNQEPNGRIRGFANWGVYTPSLIYAVAQHFLLSGDRGGLDRLLPPTLRALDWCLAEQRRAAAQTGPAAGLILAPLNDLSHDPKAWAFNQAYFFAGCHLLGRVLADIGDPRAAECNAAAQAMREAAERGFGRASVQAPLVQLRDETWIPFVPSDALTPRRLMEIWYPTDVDTGPLHLSRLEAIDPAGALTSYMLQDHEDNLFLRGWAMANEPVYNPQATVYLQRDDVAAVLRAFYSMLACAFSQTVFEPVEHRWGWGQYFGPPSTDGAWFELYRHMLIHEREGDSLLLLQATPRRWLEHGCQILVENAPTRYGPLSITVDSQADHGEITATLTPPTRRPPRNLLIRFRHPTARPLRSVAINNAPWDEFDAEREWIRIPSPTLNRYVIIARY